MKMMFGGSFDPFTLAHLEIVEYLLTNYLKNTDDILYLVPNGDNYHFGDKSLTAFNIRTEMILACIQSQKIHILDIENNKEFKGIYQTLRELNHPCYVIGSDLLYSLPTWKEPLTLLAENEFIVFNRPGYEIAKAFEEPLLNKYRDKFILTNKSITDISSSLIRTMNDEEMAKYLHPATLEIIKKYQLYRKGD